MLPYLKRNLFTVFAIFFVSITPFLIIFSLGYSLNFDQNQSQLSSSLSLNLKTLPSGSTMETDSQVFQTPVDFKIPNDFNLSFTVKKDAYKEEKFTLWSANGSNNLANFDNLVLLPKNSSTLVESNDSTKIDQVAILSDTFSLFQSDNSLFIQNYDLTGLINRKAEVKIQNGLNLTSIWSNQWTKITSSSFWLESKNILLTRVGTQWYIKSLFHNFGSDFEPQSIVSSVDNQFFVLDKTNSLWLMDIDSSGELVYNHLESGVTALTQSISPQSIWIWKYDAIYRLDKRVWSYQYFSLNDYKFWSQIDLVGQSTESDVFLKVRSIFQGIIVQTNSKLYFVPDFDSSKWKIIANYVHSFEVDSNNIFWLGKNGNLQSYNFLFKTQYNLGQSSIENLADKKYDSIKLSYLYTWKRLFLYTENQVLSVWFDGEVPNSGVVTYYPEIWIKDRTCLNQVVNRFQFCVQDNKIISYKNTEIW